MRSDPECVALREEIAALRTLVQSLQAENTILAGELRGVQQALLVAPTAPLHWPAVSAPSTPTPAHEHPF